MHELIDDKFYLEYHKFIDSAIDYCIIKCDEEYSEELHQKVVVYAINIINKRLNLSKEDAYTINKNKMTSYKINNDELFNNEYSRLFLNPPFGTPFRRVYHKNKEEIIINKPYTIEDFNYLNTLLFPNGINNLEIRKWEPNFSDYFDDGLEWWGTLCISIYDKSCNRFIVINASIID